MQVMHFCRGISGVVLPSLGSDSPLCTSRWSTLWWRTLPHGQSPCSSCLSPCTRSPRLPRACCTNGNAQLVKTSHGVLGGPVKTQNYLTSFAFSLGPVCGCAWDRSPKTTLKSQENAGVVSLINTVAGIQCTEYFWSTGSSTHRFLLILTMLSILWAVHNF